MTDRFVTQDGVYTGDEMAKRLSADGPWHYQWDPAESLFRVTPKTWHLHDEKLWQEVHAEVLAITGDGLQTKRLTDYFVERIRRART